ncbi:MAG: phosphoribosylaminoimidazolesuccinocarboxamide synthase [Actinomycetota bacterium]|nr:phosphoribosylaminoimidazolesuccinocarboxamide synthase [Actinomycetota bacterium]
MDDLTDLPGVRRVGSGKVRELYEVGDDLLLVATDRISAFDVVLPTPIPDKGRVLTGLTAFWLDLLGDTVPNHRVTTEVDVFPEVLRSHRDRLRGRAMLCRRADMVPIECVARGYLAGSGWKEYRAEGTVCGVPLPEGLTESEKLPEPIFTPATKATDGHDENIDVDRMAELVGAELTATLADLTLALYRRARDHARERGILVADTKFEFGFVDGRLTLADEVLTPDSSRFWPADRYVPGRAQPSLDKQYVRDWLESAGWDKRPPAPELPDEVVARTRERYVSAYERITGTLLDDWLPATGGWGSS